MVQSKSFLFIAVFGVLSVFSLSSFLSDAAEEFGKAGYYADSLNGRKTKSGEVYDKKKFTCAHMTLPFGTKIRVTRLDTDRSVVVTVNDRGKFVEGYVVDLSRAAAEQIDLIQKGVARVKVEIVDEAPETTKKSTAKMTLREKREAETEMEAAATKGIQPAEYRSSRKLAAAKSPATSKGAFLEPEETDEKAAKSESTLYKIDMKKTTKNGFGVQVCTLDDADNVLPIVQKLEKNFPNRVLVASSKDGENYSYKVLVGPSKDKKTAQLELKKVSKYFKECYVTDLGEL